MTGAGSRRKGASFERWLVHRFRAVFPAAEIRRGFQTRGGAEAPDVDVPGYWIEAKAHRRVDLRAALAQAIADAAPGRVPVAVCKDNRATPLVVLRLDDFLQLITPAAVSPSSPVPAHTEPA